MYHKLFGHQATHLHFFLGRGNIPILRPRSWIWGCRKRWGRRRAGRGNVEERKGKNCRVGTRTRKVRQRPHPRVSAKIRRLYDRIVEYICVLRFTTSSAKSSVAARWRLPDNDDSHSAVVNLRWLALHCIVCSPASHNAQADSRCACFSELSFESSNRKFSLKQLTIAVIYSRRNLFWSILYVSYTE